MRNHEYCLLRMHKLYNAHYISSRSPPHLLPPPRLLLPILFPLPPSPLPSPLHLSHSFSPIPLAIDLITHYCRSIQVKDVIHNHNAMITSCDTFYSYKINESFMLKSHKCISLNIQVR